ncbi:hypothetical protein IFM89_019997 [Coptis chinensis]|uniref:Nucleobase-ascorbate transporter 1 n=1 Tax=Coptis chinensis TaxID=261450 RepID=A0A835LYW8_9MAGN|nr:hypothetical protein IFM89_019997 [Coptis chinensis]
MADISHPPMEQLQDLEYCIDSNPSWGMTIFSSAFFFCMFVMLRLMGFEAFGALNSEAGLVNAVLPTAAFLDLWRLSLSKFCCILIVFTLHFMASTVETFVLAFQNYILMLGTTVMIPSVLVPLMGGSNDDKAMVIQTLLFASGWNTILQTFCGTRLPAVVGGSYAYMIPILYIIGDSSLQQITDPHERFLHTMRAIQGALLVASSIPMILGFSGVWGIFSRFFSPLGMAPVVGLLGLGLYNRGFPAVGDCVEVGIPMLLIVVASSQYFKHIRPFKDIPIFERFPVLICVTIIWVYSHILTSAGAYRHTPEKTQSSCRTDKANIISSAPWFKPPFPGQWGTPTFNAGHAFAMISAVLVSMIESTIAYKAASRLAIATPPPAYVLSRGIGVQGLGILSDAVLGTGTGSTILVENVGLLGLSRVGSRRVVEISAGFMIFFSFLASVGLSFLQFTNMNSMRNLFITGLSLFLGISVPQYFHETLLSTQHLPVHTHAGWFNAFLNTIFSSPPTVGLIVAVVLDNTLEVEKSKKDRGMPWWAKFRTSRGDNRNEEFYSLPFNLNRWCPPT